MKPILLFINVLGELEDGLNCEALVDINLTLEGKRYLEGILKALNIGYQIEARSVNGEEQIHYIIESYENSQESQQQKTMNTMMLVMNVMFVFMSLSSTALAIYWLIGGIYQIFQSYVGRKLPVSLFFFL